MMTIKRIAVAVVEIEVVIPVAWDRYMAMEDVKVVAAEMVVTRGFAHASNKIFIHIYDEDTIYATCYS